MKTAFKMKTAFGDDMVEVPTEIKGFEISKDPKGAILIVSPEHHDLKFHYINPGEWDEYVGRFSRGDLFAIEFGWQSYTSRTKVLLWASSFEEAVEEAADYMKDEYPGVFIEFTAKDVEEARKELAEEKGVKPSEIDDGDAQDAATVDHMYTESGYLASDQVAGHEAEGDLKEVALTIGQILLPKDE
jgi:hypothetical protein